MVDTALKAARDDLLGAEMAFREAKERGAAVRARAVEAERRVAEAERRVAEAKRGQTRAFDEHVAGSLTASDFEKRFAATEKAEAELRAAKDLAHRMAETGAMSRALDNLRSDYDSAREVYAQAAAHAELGCDDLRDRLVGAFVLWSWGRRNPVKNMGSERGDLFLHFLTEFFEPCNRNEIEAAEAAVGKYLDDLPESLQ